MPDAPEPSRALRAERAAETAAAEARAASRRNPRQRIASGVAGGLLLYGALLADVHFRQSWFLAAIAAAVSVGAMRELFHLARYRGAEPFAGLAYLFAPLYLFALAGRLAHADGGGGGGAWFGPFGGAAGTDLPGLLLWAGALAPCLGLLFRPTTDGALAAVATTWLGMGYVAAFASAFLRLRHLSLPNAWGLDWNATGMELVFLTVFSAKMADIGALLVGKRFGRRKLIPRLSPGKTVEGFAGGVLSSMAFMAAVVAAAPGGAMRGLGYPTALALSALLALVGTAGDLVESAFKRDAAAKDAGAAIPGFGGVLDLVDSPLVAGPVMYLALLALGAR